LRRQRSGDAAGSQRRRGYPSREKCHGKSPVKERALLSCITNPQQPTPGCESARARDGVRVNFGAARHRPPTTISGVL
jgi:hypothetical protein